MKFKAAFYARHFPSVNGLRTTGVFIASERKIFFAPVEGFGPEADVIDDRLAEGLSEGLTPDMILEHLITRSNFHSSSVSKTQTVEAASMNEAAVMMLNKIAKDYVEVLK
jgi:hypothetical protein